MSGWSVCWVGVLVGLAEPRVVRQIHYVPVPVEADACLCWSHQGCECEGGQCRCGILCGCGRCGCVQVPARGGVVEIHFWLPWWVVGVGYVLVGLGTMRVCYSALKEKPSKEHPGCSAVVLGTIWPLLWLIVAVVVLGYILVTFVRGRA